MRRMKNKKMAKRRETREKMQDESERWLYASKIGKQSEKM